LRAGAAFAQTLLVRVAHPACCAGTPLAGISGMHWHSILVPHDFSASANHATAVARDEAKAHAGKLMLLHVVELPATFGPDTNLVLPDRTETPIGMRQYAVTSAVAHLEDIAERLAKDGVEVTTYVRVGSAVDAINQLAAEQGADVIVMGTHGRTGFRRMIAGSVAEKVVRTSAVPVLTIRHPD
jgi:nucleotide-binding universal stress UspA family protein